MTLALEYINSFPPTLPQILIRKILNMRPRHPVAELFATETLDLMHEELFHFYMEGAGQVWGPGTGLNVDVSEDQILLHCPDLGLRQNKWSFAECFFFCYLWKKGRQYDDWAIWSEDSEGDEYCISCDNSDCTCRVWFEEDFYENYGKN